MSWSYNSSLAALKDQVRFLVQDVDTNRQLVQDEEITWVLSQEANIYMAGARVCEVLAGKSGNVGRKKVGDMELWYDAKLYAELAKTLRARGVTYQAPYAGGISVSDKATIASDSDWPEPTFARGQFDNPQVLSNDELRNPSQ